MPVNSRLPANLTIITNMRASGNARLPSHEHMTAQNHIMRKVHQIIELAALADNCIAQSAAINGAIGANFYIGLNDNAAKLRYFSHALCRAQSQSRIARCGFLNEW